MEHIINVKNLYKSYGDVDAVSDISFHVKKGEVFALLGPNGAGKSTTIDTMCTLLRPDKGDIEIAGYSLGRDDKEIRKKIGVVFQESVLDPMLTIRRNLEIRGKFYGFNKAELKKAIEEVSIVTGIEDLLEREYENLSGGQKRRCDIARALINKPEILFLDEPTTGLDPQMRKFVWETILKLNKEKGLTIILTTHYMEEVNYAQYVMLINKGKIVAEDTPEALKEKYAKDHVDLTCKDIAQVQEIIDKKNYQYHIDKNKMTVFINHTMDARFVLEDIYDFLEGFEVHRGNMDEVFLNIAGRAALC